MIIFRHLARIPGVINRWEQPIDLGKQEKEKKKKISTNKTWYSLPVLHPV